MSSDQQRWLEAVALKIPRLFDRILNGSIRAQSTAGQRIIHGRRIRLTLRVEVVDPEANPLRSHGATWPAD